MAIPAAFLISGGVANAQQTELMVSDITFVNHVAAGMVEQDAFVEKVPGSGKVYRVTATEAKKYLDFPVYTTKDPHHHAPFATTQTGPFTKGTALGVTLGEWLAGTGTAAYSCKGGTATLNIDFEKLVPNGTYTVWNFMVGKPHMGCADCPFSTIDFPMGARDGTQSVLTAGTDGTATYTETFTPCLPLGNELLASAMALAYHSDGKTYGKDPGQFGNRTHVQIFALLPDQGAWEVAAK
ncbi:MAG: hypothetical protein GKS02_04595 [Alphaproteobacteria bacterium]|nr:hypothetical protein [Alphaproteobacteria bacterium]